MLPACAGGYYGTSEPKDSRQGIPGYFPDLVIAALGFRQYAAVGCYPTHVLHGSDEGGFCAMRKMVAYRHWIWISGYGVSWLPVLFTRRITLKWSFAFAHQIGPVGCAFAL